MSFTPAIPSLSAPMGASPKPTLVLDLEGVAGQEVKLHEWLDASDGSYYDCVVDWGDGTVERVNEDNFQTASHTYADDATSVEARVVGKCSYLQADWTSTSALKLYLIAINAENTSPIVRFSQPFCHYEVLKTVEGDIFENCTSDNSCIACFHSCLNLEEVAPETFSLLTSTNFVQYNYNNGNLVSTSINIWKTTNYGSCYGHCNKLCEVCCYNIPADSTHINDFIDLLPNRINWTGEGTPTLYIRKNIPEARDTLTEEQEAALNARGWILGTETTS